MWVEAYHPKKCGAAKIFIHEQGNFLIKLGLIFYFLSTKHEKKNYERMFVRMSVWQACKQSFFSDTSSLISFTGCGLSCAKHLVDF